MKETVIRLAGPQVEVPDMLLARDGRAAAQKSCWNGTAGPCCSLPRISQAR